MRYLIVGAVAGGASAAARLRRLDEHAEILIFERGKYISYANCGLPYYIGNVIKDRNKLFVQTAASFNKRFNIDIRIQTEVLSIDIAGKKVKAKNLRTGIIYEEHYDKLVLSPGAEPVKPPLPGIDTPGIFTLRNVADTDYIKSFIGNSQVKTAVIIGAGFIGLEMAENLHHAGLNVTIVEMGNQVLAPVDLPMAAIVQQHLRAKGVRLLLNTAVSGFEKQGKGLSVQFTNEDAITTDVVILSIGVRPDTRLAADAGLRIGSARGIFVNEFLQTSDPDVYAVGDAIEFANPITGNKMITYLAGPANKQGRICANNIAGGNSETYKGAINTAILKVFELTAGATGMAAKHLAAAGIPHFVSTTHSGAHAGYYPGSRDMTIQTIFSPGDGRLLGAQIVGYEGVDKRLDVLSMVIQQKGSVHDLAAFEHAYAPPFSSARDPVNMAGFVAENILADKLHVFYWDQLPQNGESYTLVDVRSADEFMAGAIDGAINIPVDNIRERLDELSKVMPVYIYCEAGIRGDLAQRILRQSGFDRVFNLSGGYRLWKILNEESRIGNKIIKL